VGEPTYLVVGIGTIIVTCLAAGVGYLYWYWNYQYPKNLLGGKHR
jgi:hypothetical protein